MKAYLPIAATLIAIAGSAQAGPISRACLGSDRPAASPGVCGCIQRVADAMLTGQDQRLAAKFFKDPDHAQEIKMSKTASHDSFWERYTMFGDAATRSCTS